jgi:hypothetical protein
VNSCFDGRYRYRKVACYALVGRLIILKSQEWWKETQKSTNREAAIQNGMDGARFPNAATVAETYLIALESKITGQPIFVEGYRP